jgi:osmotically-inducible protein OsmY
MPKNNVQDENLKKMVLQKLKEHPMLKKYNIFIQVMNQQVILFGVVDDLAIKWLVEDIVADLMGVLSINNRIELRKSNHAESHSFYVE